MELLPRVLFYENLFLSVKLGCPRPPPIWSLCRRLRGFYATSSYPQLGSTWRATRWLVPDSHQSPTCASRNRVVENQLGIDRFRRWPNTLRWQSLLFLDCLEAVRHGTGLRYSLPLCHRRCHEPRRINLDSVPRYRPHQQWFLKDDDGTRILL